MSIFQNVKNNVIISNWWQVASDIAESPSISALSKFSDASSL